MASQTDGLKELFDSHGGRLTLGEILENWKIAGSKYTNRISELRSRLELENPPRTIRWTRAASGRQTESVYDIVPKGAAHA